MNSTIPLIGNNLLTKRNPFSILMMPAKKGNITAPCIFNGLRIKKNVLPSDKMAFPKNACGDISLSSKLALMVDVYACFSTLTNCIERSVMMPRTEKAR